LLTDSISQKNPRPYLIQKYALNTAYTIAECGFRIADFGMKGIPQSAIHIPQSETYIPQSAIHNPQSEFVYAGFSHGFDGIKSNDGSKKPLDVLPASKAHIEKIHQWYRKIGKSHQNTTMTRQDFMAIAPKSRITEIATHAGFDAQDSRRTSIYFPKQDTTEALELSTIYNMNWSANELLVLIACQTAKGLVVKGETVISIAYAFGYAGAQRRIAALWSISNDASVDLMNAFFQNLLKNNHPALALKQAQCQLLDNGQLPSSAKTPNKWAGLALSGNIAAISE
jgi:CHAT domain-containing protein